jgi:hypothetical protein
MNYETNNIEILLPNNPIVIKFLKLNNKEQLKVIELGQLFLTNGQHKIQYWNNEETEQIIKNIKKKSNNEINELKTELTNKKKEIYNLIETHKNNNITIENEIKQQISTIYREKIDNYKQDISKLKQDIENYNTNIDNIKNKMYDDLLEKLNNKDKLWIERIDKQKNHYESLLNDERKKREKLTMREQNSTIKGIDGEEFTLQELNKRFPTAEIEDTHKQSNRGDFIIKTNNLHIMIENKNYARNVPKIEIDKFYNDMKVNADINAGIFVSLKSGICKKEDFQLEIINEKPVIFLHKIINNIDNITKAVMLLTLICNKDCIDTDNKELLDKLTNFSPTLKRNLSKMKKSLKKHEIDMLSCLINQETIMKEIFTLFKIKY